VPQPEDGDQDDVAQIKREADTITDAVCDGKGHGILLRWEDYAACGPPGDKSQLLSDPNAEVGAI
jgi:hypothetical protein